MGIIMVTNPQKLGYGALLPMVTYIYMYVYVYININVYIYMYLYIYISNCNCTFKDIGLVLRINDLAECVFFLNNSPTSTRRCVEGFPLPSSTLT